MPFDNSFYAVTQAIAQRAGVANIRYRTADGRYILDTDDLSRITLSSDEYITGLQGIEKISGQEADKLIKEGGHQRGLPSDTEPSTENPETSESSTPTP